MKTLFAEIAVALNIDTLFTYSVPLALAKDARVGKRALVPLGKRVVTGFIVGLACQAPSGVKDIKPVIDILDSEPLFDEKHLNFYKWMSSYYFAPLGEVLSLTQPGGAQVMSHRRFVVTETSGEAAENGTDREILEAASKGGGVALSTLLKRLKGKPVYSAVERLKRQGLLIEEVGLKGGISKKTETFVSIVSIKGPAIDPDELKRSPVQAKVYGFLKEHNEASMTELRGICGNCNDAVSRLFEKGLVEVTEKEAYRNPFSDIVPKKAPEEPNEEQRSAIEEISKNMKKNAFSPFLLYGVTGSGKTLVYLKVLEEALKYGKKAIILAPEIALTPWPAAYLADKFPGRIALCHSGLSEGERHDEWQRIAKGEADIVVGARSALFAPIKNLGLIIVDEEHETSYKQEDGVRYSARDCALMLGKYLAIPVLLGSATPSVETFFNAKEGRLRPLYMKNRVGNSVLPKVEVVDMKGVKEVFSERLKGLLGEAIEEGHQALLFLNRRGFSNFVICRDCGHTFQCLNCSVTLTFHKRTHTLKCHYCDLVMDVPEACPECSGINLITPGSGTEKVEEEVRALLPKAVVGRMDRDTTRRKGAAKRIIDAVEEKKVDILIGTQMVSKGHHFPGITLVGVISGDTSLNIPDFRSSERAFQLITQAAGRAGRGDMPGTVVIQTLNPEHYCFKCAYNHDYEGFFDEEIALRQETMYPPFSRLCNLRIEGPKEERVTTVALALKGMAERLLKNKNLGISVLGPAPALVAKLKNRFRWQMLVKARDVKNLHAFIKAVKASFEAKEGRASGVSLIIDMDPATIT